MKGVGCSEGSEQADLNGLVIENLGLSGVGGGCVAICKLAADGTISDGNCNAPRKDGACVLDDLATDEG